MEKDSITNFGIPAVEDRSVSPTSETSRQLDEAGEIQESVNNATWANTEGTQVSEWSIGDKWNAFSDTWDDTWAGRILDYTMNEGSVSQEENTNFTNTWNDESILESMKALKMPMKYYQRLSEAKNETHKKAIITSIKSEQARQERISKSLNSYGGGMNERLMSGFATGILDYDVAISGGAALVAKVTKMNKMALVGATAMHAGAGYTAYNVSEDISSSEAVFMSILGVAGDTFAISRYGSKQDIPDAVDDLSSSTLPDVPNNSKLTDDVNAYNTKQNSIVLTEREKGLETVWEQSQQRDKKGKKNLAAREADKVLAELKKKSPELYDRLKRRMSFKKDRQKAVDAREQKRIAEEKKLDAEYEADQKKIDAASDKIKKKRQEIDKQRKESEKDWEQSKKDDIEKQEKQLIEEEKQLAENQKKMDDKFNQTKKDRAEIEARRKESEKDWEESVADDIKAKEAERSKLDAEEKQLNIEYEANQKKMDEATENLSNKRKEIEANRKEAEADYDEAKLDELKSQEKKLIEKEAELLDNQKRMDAGYKKLDQKKKEVEASRKEAEADWEETMSPYQRRVARELEEAKKQKRVDKTEFQRRKLEDSRKVESNFKTFSNKVDELVEQAKAKGKIPNNWKAKRMVHIQKQLSDMKDDLVQNVTEWRATIREAIQNGDSKILKEIDDVVDELFKHGYLDKGTYQHYKNQLGNKNYDSLQIRMKMDKDGNYIPVGTKGKKKLGKNMVIGALGLSLASSQLQAGDFEDVVVGGIGAIIVGAGLFFVAGGNLKSIGRGMSNMYQKAKEFDRTRPMREKLDSIISSARTSMNETLTPLLAKESSEFKELVRKILWDAEDGTYMTVERNKAALYHSYSNRLKRGMDEDYHEYIKESGLSRPSSALKNAELNEITPRLEFEQKVMEYIESGKHTDSPAIVKAGEEVKKINAEVRQMMIDSGVKGADKMLDIKDALNWMPRYVRSAEMRVLVKSMDGLEYDKFVKKFANMMDGNIDKADAYIQTTIAISEYSGRKITKIDEVQEFLNQHNIKNISADEVADMFGVSQSTSARVKARTFIDKSKFEEFTVNIDGVDKKVTLNELFVNNSIEAMDRHLNSTTGHIALAQAGFNSLDDIYEEIANGAIHTSNAKVLDDIVGIIVGKPILDVGSDSAKLLQIASNLTVALKMPFSVLSLTQEAFNTVVKSRGNAFKTFTQEFKNIFMKHGKSSAIVEELTDFMGQGQHKHSASYGTYSHMSEAVDNMMTSATGVQRASEIARDTVLYNLGLVPVSDFLTRINLVDSASYLHDIVNGSQKMPQYMKDIIGLTPDIENMLKGKLTMKNGSLQKLGLKDWNIEDQLAFKKVVDNMMQKRIQMATIGGTPHWSRSNTLGMYMSGLMKFPLQAFSNHGLVDLKGTVIHKDPRAMASMMAWFAGGYIASMMRYEMKGRDYTDDDLIMSAMLSMPIVGAPYGIYSLVTNGSAMQNAMSDISMGMTDVTRMIATGE